MADVINEITDTHSGTTNDIPVKMCKNKGHNMIVKKEFNFQIIHFLLHYQMLLPKVLLDNMCRHLQK